MLTFSVRGAFPFQGALIRQATMEFDLFANGGFVFPQNPRNGGLCGSITDTGLDNPAFLQGQGFVFVVNHRNLNLLMDNFLYNAIILHEGSDTNTLVYGLLFSGGSWEKRLFRIHFLQQFNVFMETVRADWLRSSPEEETASFMNSTEKCE